MSRHYSPNDFFRQTPKKVLARFFEARGVLADFDFTAIKDGKSDALFAAWLVLPDAERKPIDTVFSEIFDMSCTDACFTPLGSLKLIAIVLPRGPD